MKTLYIPDLLKAELKETVGKLPYNMQSATIIAVRNFIDKEEKNLIKNK